MVNAIQKNKNNKKTKIMKKNLGSKVIVKLKYLKINMKLFNNIFSTQLMILKDRKTQSNKNSEYKIKLTIFILIKIHYNVLLNLKF